MPEGYEVYEVTIRIPVDASEKDPVDWEWEAMLGVSTEVLSSDQVEGFASPSFQQIYEQIREEELGGESIVDQMRGLG